MTTESIQSVSVPERIETMERLWDSICHAEQEPDSPEWHAGVVRERGERLHSGKSTTLSLEELETRLGR